MKFAILGLALFATSAFAGDAIVEIKSIDGGSHTATSQQTYVGRQTYNAEDNFFHYGFALHANNETGKAVVEFQSSDWSSEVGGYEPRGYDVAGLSFDKEKNAVTYNGIVCATAKKRLGYLVLKDTGNCLVVATESKNDTVPAGEVNPADVIEINFSLAIRAQK